jgi:DNA-binding transcriptional ArsR family regulator
MQIDQAATSFQAMGSEARLSVLRALVRAGDDGLVVGDIQARTGIAPSTLSHHLKTLSDAGVIEQTKLGRTLLTRAAYDHLRALAGFILAECCFDAGAASSDHHHPQAEPA